MNSLNHTEISVDDTFRILVATDIHLGYAEKDPERGEDSFNTFEEILQLAKDHAVDFVLLGGDLFHENKPSTQCLYKCMALLRKYCMGEKPVSVEFLSDQEVNFQHCFQRQVNYEDPNLNVSIPVFTIHGNHDDPCGHVQLSSMDVLSVSGLINYFGKWTDFTEVKVLPMLMRKGSSKLAIYGLSHIKDERLSRLFRDQKVHMYRPKEDTNDWFNIFVCHQNRFDRGVTKYIPEQALPNFLDLVIWGHEHECRIEGEWNAIQEFHVIQPGSPVATSLCDGEAKEKFVGLLHIYNKKFKLVPLKLQTVRPFKFETIVLSECDIGETDHNMAINVQNYLTERIEFLITSSENLLTGHPKQPKLPLIRARVEFNDESQCFNAIRFGQQFQSQVANPTDMILLRREKLGAKKARNVKFDKDNIEEFLKNEEVDDIWEVKMNLIIEKYFNEVSSAKPLNVLSVRGISEAAARYIDKGDRESVERTFNHQLEKLKKYVFDENVNLDGLDDAIKQFKINRINNPSEAEENVDLFDANLYRLPDPGISEEPSRISDSDKDSDNDQQFDQPLPAQKGRGRASRAARAPRAPSTRTRARGSRSRGSASATSTITQTITTTSRRSTRTASVNSQSAKLSRLQYVSDDSD